MRSLRFLVLSTIAVIAVAATGGRYAAAQVTVMTQNLYVGFDLEQYAVDAAANPLDIPALTAAAYADVLATDFPSRAAAFARQVEATQPELIGLQEVSLFRSGDFDGLGAPHAMTVEIDFLQLTLGALADRGLFYEAVATIQNADVEVPRVIGFDGMNQPILQDIRLTDRDVILWRTDLPPGAFAISNAQSANFTDALSFLGASVPRGWASVDVQYGDLEFRLVSTHLENEPTVQVAQANELLAPGGPIDTPLDVVLIGDFNSPADGTLTPTYANLLAAGFADAWTMTHGGAPGYTWGHDADLLNTIDTFTERIDLVLLGGGLTATFTDIVGEALDERTPAGLWLSDHAGVVATIVPEPHAAMLALIGCLAFTAVGHNRGIIRRFRRFARMDATDIGL
jgi:hypothetical protein